MYSNVGAALAAHAVEGATGTRFRRHTTETFFEPLGMNHTDATAPMWSTDGLIEQGRSGWEAGLSLHTEGAKRQHTTRAGVVGATFRPALSHRVSVDGSWLTGSVALLDHGPVVQIQGGRSF